MVLSVAAPAFAAATDLTDEEIAGLTTSVNNIASTDDFRDKDGVNTMIADTPAKYIFKPASGDTKSYILLKNVNAGEDDGYFVMVQDGGLKTDTADSAVAKLRAVYPGTYIGNDEEIKKKNYEEPSVIFDVSNKKSVAYYLNTDTYIDGQFSVMKNYINEHTWYTEGTKNAVKPYKTNAKIALPSVSEYKANIDRIGVNSIAKGQSSVSSIVHFILRTAHPNDMDAKYSDNKYTTKAIWLAKNYENSLSMQNGVAVYTWLTVERPCFYLSKDFFKKVKLDMSLLTTADSEAAKIIKEIAAEENGIATLNAAGYTNADLAELGIAIGNVKITSAAISGDGKCGETITADVKTDGAATKIEYDWHGVKANGADTSIAATETNTYTIKFADLDYAKIYCLVKAYSDETLSHSLSTNEITLETKPTFPTYTSVVKENDVKDTVEANKFTVEGREFAILRSVNATEDDGIFVAVSIPVAPDTVKYYDVTADEFKKLEKLIYNAKDEKSMAYVVNQPAFWDREYLVNRTDTTTRAKIIPNSLRNYINEHRWWNEGANNSFYTQDPWTTEAKVAIMSASEYYANRDIYGYGNINSRTYILRSSRYYKDTSTSVAATATNPQLVVVQDNATYRLSQNGVTDSSRENYGKWYAKPICFYLNPEFFANVKVDFTKNNTEVINKLREALKDKTVDELVRMEYSYNDIKILFPTKIANLGKIAMYSFSNDNGTIGYKCENISDGEVTFKPVIAVYTADGAMVGTTMKDEAIKLASGASQEVTLTLNIENSANIETLKAFAWDVETLKPFAPCKDVDYTSLAPET